MRLVSNLKTKLLVVGEREVKAGFIVEKADLLCRDERDGCFVELLKLGSNKFY